jgi:hypothetical protein
VGDLAVLPLVLRQEAQARSRLRPLAGRGHRQRVDRRVAAEEPAEAGARAVARRAPPGDETAAEVGVADPLLVEVHLRPLEGEVEPIVGRVDPQALLAQGVRAAAALGVEPGRAGEEPPVGGGRLRARSRPGRDRDRHHLPGRPRGVDRDREGAGRVGERVGGVARGAPRPGRADERVSAAQALRQDEGPVLFAPERVLAAEAARPGVLEDGAEARHDLERAERVDLQQDEEARLVERRYDVLAHGEAGVAVGDRGGLRPHLDGPGHVPPAHRLHVLGHAEAELEARGELQRVHPQLRFPRLGAEPGRARADDAQVLPRAHVAAEADRRRGDLESRDDRQRLRPGLGRSSREQQAEAEAR